MNGSTQVDHPAPAPDALDSSSTTSLPLPVQVEHSSSAAPTGAAQQLQSAAGPSNSTMGEGAAPDQPVLSKSALKRQRKEEAFKAAKQQRRAYEKEKRKAKTAETRRLVAEGLMEKPAPKKKKVVGRQSPYGARVVVDMGFDELMTDKEVKSMSSQLAYCYSANRNVQHPFPLLISSFNGRLRQIFENRKDHASWRGVEWWEEGFEGLYDGRFDGEVPPAAETAKEGATTPATVVAQTSPSPPAGDHAQLSSGVEPTTSPSSADPSSSLAPSLPPAPSALPALNPAGTSSSAKVQIGALAGRPRSTCPKSSVIYLTGDSPNVLTALEPGKTYVLGGIVDRNRYKNLCLNKANELGIAHAQLPIGEFLPEMQTRKVLTVNQVYEILINWVADPDGGWREALRKVMPERKFDPDARAKRKAARKGGEMVDGVYVAGEDDEEEEEGEEEGGSEALIVEKVEEARSETEQAAAEKVADTETMAADGSAVA